VLCHPFFNCNFRGFKIAMTEMPCAVKTRGNL
jgi:hypothetical protein